LALGIEADRVKSMYYVEHNLSLRRSGAYGIWRRCAFSLIELVIVIVIIGLIAAIAVPKLSSATQKAKEAQVEASIHILQDAVDRYAAQHQGPCIWSWGDDECRESLPATSYGIKQALTKETELSGRVSSGGGHGPYLRVLPENLNRDDRGRNVAVDNSGSIECVVRNCGWIMDVETLEISECLEGELECRGPGQSKRSKVEVENRGLGQYGT